MIVEILVAVFVVIAVVAHFWGFGQVLRLPADEAAATLWEAWYGSQSNAEPSTAGLPDKLHGVFWMQGNPAAEVLMTMGAMEGFDPLTRTGWLRPYGYRGWTFCNNCFGWTISFLGNALMRTTVRLEFNEDYTYGKMHCYNLGLPLPSWVFEWGVEQMGADGLVWDRQSKLCCGQVPGGYTLVKILAKDGSKTAKYGDFEKCLMEGAPDYSKAGTELHKTKIQLVQNSVVGLCRRRAVRRDYDRLVESKLVELAPA